MLLKRIVMVGWLHQVRVVSLSAVSYGNLSVFRPEALKPHELKR